jgi:hypothetical protein
LSGLKGNAVQVSANEAYPGASVIVSFTNGSRLRAEYWRLIKGRRPVLSSFDHEQQYGLPAPINAPRALCGELQGKLVLDAALDRATADLNFAFSGDLRFQVFNFTGYEIWQLTWPDGTGELSNYALE